MQRKAFSPTRTLHPAGGATPRSPAYSPNACYYPKPG